MLIKSGYLILSLVTLSLSKGICQPDYKINKVPGQNQSQLSAFQDKYRWDIKLGIDTSAQRIFPFPPTPKTLNELVNIQRPPNAERKAGRANAEKNKVCVSAYIVMLGKEDDNDYHLVLQSPDGKDSLIAEIPDAEWLELKNFPQLKNHFANSRAFIDSCIPGHTHRIHSITPIKVNITGILFFDKIAHGKGHARNGIEIHPVLEIIAE